MTDTMARPAAKTTKQPHPGGDTGDAYIEGANAYLAGTAREDNPYPKGTEARDSWDMGWDCEAIFPDFDGEED